MKLLSNQSINRLRWLWWERVLPVTWLLFWVWVGFEWGEVLIEWRGY